MPPSFTASLILRGRDQASAAVKGVQSSFGKLTSFLASKFVFTAGDVARAVRAISDTLNRSTEEAIKAEQATRLLDVALSQAGDSTDRTKVATEEWTKALQASTTTSQEAIKEGAALALQFGVQTEDLEKFTRTALDFAGAADIGFTEAVRRMGRALSGSTEDIAKFSPAIADLTKQQLRAGDATDLLADAVGGIAEALADTYAGALDSVTTQQREFLKAIGETITESEELKEVLTSQAGVYKALAEDTDGAGTAALNLKIGLERLKLQVLEDIAVFIGLEGGIDNVTAAFNRQGTVVQGSTIPLLGRLVLSTAQLAGRTSDAADATRDLTSAGLTQNEHVERRLQLLKQDREDTKVLNDELRELGVVLNSDVAEALEKDRELLERLDVQIRLGGENVDAYAVAFDQASRRIEENEFILRGHTATQENSTQEFGNFTAAAFDSTGAVDGYTVSLERARSGLIDLQRQQTTGVPPRASSINVGGLDARPDQGGLFPGLSGTSYTYTFETSEEADDFVRRVNQQSRGGP